MKTFLQKLGTSILTLFGVSILNFAMMSFVGNPIEMLAGGPHIQETMLQEKAIALGLNKPWYIQYVNWLKQVLQGDFGISYKTYQPVSSMIQQHLKPTLVLMGTGLLIAIIISIFLGIYSATHQNSKKDYAILSFTFIAQSIPGFFLALLFIYLFTIRFPLLPSHGLNDFQQPGISFRYLLLPSLVLAIGLTGDMIRYIRSSMLEILDQEFIRVAKGKGIGRKKVIYKHAFKNALIPLITIITMEIPYLFGGSVILEQIFSWPGLGLLTVNAILQRDYPVIMAMSFLTAIIVILSNLLQDLLYMMVDPSIKIGGKKA